MPGILKDWPDSAGSHPQRLYEIEQLLGQLTTVTAATYAASVASDCAVSGHVTVSATDTNNFAIAAPSNPKKGRTITFDIANASGGSLGTVTFAAIFKLAGAFTNPANGKRRTISFKHDGTVWVETHRASADI